MRMLISEPTTTFNFRAMSSKLKGVRGLGGVEGLQRILGELKELGLVEFLDNDRAARLLDDSSAVQVLKRFAAMCDLESLCKLLEPVASKVILFGSRASGRARTDSDYDLFIVTEDPATVSEIAHSHPLGKSIEVVAWTPDMYSTLEKRDAALARKLETGIVLLGSTW